MHKSLCALMLGSIMLGVMGCALAARTGTVAGAAAAGGALGGPVGAGVGAGIGLLSVEAYQGEVLGGQVRDAAFSGAPPGLSFWGFVDRNWVWFVVIGVLLFTPSTQYLLGRLKKWRNENSQASSQPASGSPSQSPPESFGRPGKS